jgi:DNA-binding transcriptional regulator GbsR (MarR family)
LTDKQRFVEELGLFFEHAGSTRMMGRILGHLLIAKPPLQSADDLADALQVSRGAISTSMRQLVERALVDRVSLPGQRRDYYQIRPGAWAQVLQRSLELTTEFRRIADRGLALLRDQPPEDRQRLEEMRSVYTFFEERLPELFAEWERAWQQQRATGK